ncbi:MAG: Clp protease N-terminal domain-containing protein [Thermoguttaceae bacterium]|jgi:ATP-dependent Clp protease ATP-binding subunit ClpC
MYAQFTERARKTMQYAEEEARRLHHACIGPEHILLGLLREGTGVAANVLKNLGADEANVRAQVERLVPIGSETVPGGETARKAQGKKTLVYAMEESRSLNHNWVGTEHLLLGLLHEERGPVAQVLATLGLTLQRVRSELLFLFCYDVGTRTGMGREPGLKEGNMIEFHEENSKEARDFLGPHAVDRMIRQAIAMCWMVLPDERRSLATVESEIRRVVDRALANLKEDAQAFGIPKEE